MVQNKFHYAIAGQTGAEIVYSHADHKKENMGLTTWKNSPDGRILKSDVKVAKNYLNEEQIRRLERTVSGYFDYIEDLTERENTFTMQEFADSINEFLAFRRYKILPDKGKISRKTAEEMCIRDRCIMYPTYAKLTLNLLSSRYPVNLITSNIYSLFLLDDCGVRLGKYTFLLHFEYY